VSQHHCRILNRYAPPEGIAFRGRAGAAAHPWPGRVAASEFSLESLGSGFEDVKSVSLSMLSKK